MSSFMSPLRPRPPAAATRRGAGLALPKSPLPSAPKPLPPPPLRPSSMVRVELKPCSTTSVEYFSTPLWSVHLRVCSAPSMYTLEPFFRYCSAILASPSLKITTRCHSVFSLRSPVALSRQLSEVATLMFTTGRPSCMRRTSGSLPRLPTRMTLLTEPAIETSTRNPKSPYTYRPRGAPAESTCPRQYGAQPSSRMFSFCSSIVGSGQQAASGAYSTLQRAFQETQHLRPRIGAEALVHRIDRPEVSCPRHQ